MLDRRGSGGRPGRWPAAWCAVLGTAMLAACSNGPTWVGEPAEPRPAPILEGTNWDGESFSLDETRGKATVVFFGYTLCPDICPLALAKMQQVERELGASAGELEVVFVSVDPHRDSVERLSHYVPNFGDQFYGIHVPAEELGALQERWGLTVQYGQPKDGPGTDSYYYVDHTGTFFLLDREGTLRVTHPPNADAQALLPDIETLIAS
ncbi:MAG: SCO family protein [Acidobacteriota bacterium]